MGDHFCLKWKNHQQNLIGIMMKLLEEQKFVDVSLICEMKTFKAHQTVLSASSPYFEKVFEENPHPHPIIILKDIKESEMKALLQYIYGGEVSVRDNELSGFLQTARALKVRGLSEDKEEMVPLPQQNVGVAQIEMTPAPPKRPRTNEQEMLEKHLLDSQSPTATSNMCKSSLKASTTSAGPPVSSYSENSEDMHYSNSSTPSQTIKQEMEGISVPSEEASAMSHLVNLEPRSDHCHKQGDWNFDYGHPVENRNHQTQKAIPARGAAPQSVPSGYLELQSPVPLTAGLREPGGVNVFEGSKQWYIKYAFEKIEGIGFKCKICGEMKKHVRNHYLKHFPEHHQCHLCKRTYTRKDNLNSHLKRDHFKNFKTYQDPYHRFRQLTDRLEDYHGFQGYMPDLYPSLTFPSPMPTSSLRPHPSPTPAPIDLSFKSAPLPQYTPIYNIFPSLYSYFTN